MIKENPLLGKEWQPLADALVVLLDMTVPNGKFVLTTYALRFGLNPSTSPYFQGELDEHGEFFIEAAANLSYSPQLTAEEFEMMEFLSWDLPAVLPEEYSNRTQNPEGNNNPNFERRFSSEVPREDIAEFLLQTMVLVYGFTLEDFFNFGPGYKNDEIALRTNLGRLKASETNPTRDIFAMPGQHLDMVEPNEELDDDEDEDDDYDEDEQFAHRLVVTYSPQYLDWQLGSGDGTHPTNPIRAKLATEFIQEQFGSWMTVVDPLPNWKAREDIEILKNLHDPLYVQRTLDGYNSEWQGQNIKTANAGLAMFSGTVRGVELILNGGAKVVFNPQGAKHHAKYDHGSGFCVFNDMAYAAKRFQEAGLRPLYIDWDIHAGDGVYHMLKGTGIPTISIHNGSNFPVDPAMQSLDGTRRTIIDEENLSYNFNLLSGDGDTQLIDAIWEAEAIIRDYKPDVILLAAGADGHQGPNLLGVTNNYSSLGFEFVADLIGHLAAEYCDGRILIGGAGGYQPFEETPRIWAQVVGRIWNKITRINF